VAKKSNGSALIMVITLSMILLLVALGTTLASVSDTNITMEEKITTELEMACESGLNRAKSKLEQAYFLNQNIVSLEPNIAFQSNMIDDFNTAPDDNEKLFENEEFIIASGENPDYYSFYVQAFDNNNIEVRYSISEDTDWTKSGDHTTYTVNIEASAYAPGVGWVGMSEKAYVNRSTLYTFSIFFEDELEILPGQNMDLKGKIHTNDDLYISPDGSTLNIKTDSLTAAGEMFRKRYNDNRSGGTVNITQKNKDGVYQGMSTSEDSRSDSWISDATQKWRGSVADKHLGATRIKAPDLKSIEPDGFYDQKSDLNIRYQKADGLNQEGYKVKYQDSEIFYPLTNDCDDLEDELNNDNITKCIQTGDMELKKALYESNFWDNREAESTGDRMVTTNVDVQRLDQIINKPGETFDEDGVLVYMTRDDAIPDSDNNQYSPDPNRKVTGFKLTNGATLPAPVTFVSNLPAYIEGDFNKHTSTNIDDDNWKPAAVISDAISVLSNNWQDDNSSSSSIKNASSTEINTVFITGNVPTDPRTGQYSGGFENFPRMLESWSGKTLKIRGGFIQLFRSQYATGNWKYGSPNYQAPGLRDWGAEDYFEGDIGNLPPMFTDLFPSVAQGIYYSNWEKIPMELSALHNSEE
jgi:hypothetical protein